MIRLSKSLFAVGGVVLAGGLISFTNPKTVHAVAAALVQVTNTATNPVVTQSVEQIAQVQVFCESSSQTCKDTGGNDYVVPANQNLVVTSIDLTGCTSESTLAVLEQVAPGNHPGFPRIPINLPATTNTTHLIYPSGIAFSGMTTLRFSISPNCITAGATLYGYLSTN
jgi:hypothetical protein